MRSPTQKNPDKIVIVRDLPKTNVGPAAFSSLVDCITRAAERRRRVLDDRLQEAWRVVNGPGDGAPPGLTIDRYGSWLVLAARDRLGDDAIEAWARAALAACACDGIVLKTLLKPASRSSSRVFSGTLPKEPIRVREEDAVFLCDLDDGLATGLYLDHHDTRLAIRPWARDREVLNLFAYTCAFSVHAALGGAARVTSVDISKKFLRRGRENMAASALDPDRHRWFADDVGEHLDRTSRRGARYGLVILDPPVFGRAGRKVHQLEKDLEALCARAISVIEPEGVLVISVHAIGMDSDRLRSAVERPAGSQGRAIEVVEELGLPEWDHPARARVPLDLDRGQYLKTLVLRIG
jgi:23S rRNA (cytosine1962-C5)-methyltransferase